MASKETWNNWHNPSSTNKRSDEEILSMIDDVVQTIHNLERMYPNDKARLIITGLIAEYITIESIAFARGLKARRLNP